MDMSLAPYRNELTSHGSSDGNMTVLEVGQGVWVFCGVGVVYFDPQNHC